MNKLQSVRQYATIVIVRDWTHSEEMHTWLQGNGERELKFTHDERRELREGAELSAELPPTTSGLSEVHSSRPVNIHVQYRQRSHHLNSVTP